MVTDQQVRPLRQKLMKGKTQESATEAAGMSVLTTCTWRRRSRPPQQNCRGPGGPDRFPPLCNWPTLLAGLGA